MTTFAELPAEPLESTGPVVIPSEEVVLKVVLRPEGVPDEFVMRVPGLVPGQNDL